MVYSSNDLFLCLDIHMMVSEPEKVRWVAFIVQLYVLSDVHNQVSFVLATKLMNVVSVPWLIVSQAHAYFLVIFVSYCLQ